MNKSSRLLFQGDLYREIRSHSVQQPPELQILQVHEYCYKYRDIQGRELLGCLGLKVSLSRVMHQMVASGVQKRQLLTFRYQV